MLVALPIHPLVVHFAVVFVPLAFIALLAVVAVKRWREKYVHLAVIAAVIAAVFAVIARVSGGHLAVINAGAPSSHAFWGNLLVIAAIISATLALVWFLMLRKQQDAPLNDLIGWVTVAVAGVAMILTVLAGHSGAESVWGSVGADKMGEATPAATVDEAASAGATSPAEAGAALALTMAEVGKHNTAQSCYTVINDSVYDLTDWIAKHPGGAGAIEGLCGTDGTAAFEGKHGGSASIAQTLEKFKIGALSK